MTSEREYTRLAIVKSYCRANMETYQTESADVLKECSLKLMRKKKLLHQFLCTEGYKIEMIAGWLLSEGYIQHKRDLITLAFSDTNGSVQVDFLEKPIRYATKPVESISWEQRWVYEVEEVLERKLPMYEKTQSVHSCFLIQDGEIVFQCEDIGRHNAIDKALGYGLLHEKEIALKRCMLYSSGRAPADMAEKVIRAGVPVFISKSMPTYQSVELARKYGLTLIGNARKDKFIQFA